MHINLLTRLLLEHLVEKTNHYNLSPDDCYMISMASAFHDIGKIGIDEKILNKPGKLTKEEFEQMKQHTVIGASMLDHMERYKDCLLYTSSRSSSSLMRRMSLEVIPSGGLLMYFVRNSSILGFIMLILL